MKRGRIPVKILYLIVVWQHCLHSQAMEANEEFQSNNYLKKNIRRSKRSISFIRSEAQTFQDNATDIVRVAATTIAPPIELVQLEDGSWIAVRGFEFNLLEVIANKINFKYKIVIPPDNLWGVKDKNGTWTGLLGLIQRKEADMIICTSGSSYEKASYFDLSFPYMQYDVIFYTKAPKEILKSTAIIHTFSFQLWIGIFVTLFVVPYLLLKIQNISKGNKENKTTYGGTLWILFSYLINQGTEASFIPKWSLSGWLIFAVIITSSYSGILMSLLTLPQYEPVIKDFKELAEATRSGKIRPSILKSTGIEKKIHTGTSYVEKILGRAMKEDENSMVENFFLGAQQVLDSNYAFIGLDMAAFGVTYRVGKEKFFISEDSLYSGHLCVIASKGFPYIQQIDKIILQTLSGGLFQKWRNDESFELYRDYELNRIHEDTGPQQITVKQLIGAFFILIFGYGLATICLITEIVWCKCKNNKQTEITDVKN